MARQRIDEFAEIRAVMDEPTSFADGFGWKSLVAILFVSLVMVPANIYLGLVIGGSMGGATTWVVIILLVEICKRGRTTFTQQELCILGMVIGSTLAAESGTFSGPIWNVYLRSSEPAKAFGLSHLFPDWVCPAPDSEAIRTRTFFHPDWLKPICLMLIFDLMGRINQFGLGYYLFRVTSDVEKLPFPFAPIHAQASIALAENSSDKDSNRRKVFTIGMVIGLVWGVIYAGVPMFTNAFLSEQLRIIPIPWYDLTPFTEKISFLQTVPLAISFDISSFIAGTVVPFWAVLGGALGSFAILIMNPILHSMGILKTWEPGMDYIQTSFGNNLDFWMSFGYGTGVVVAIAGIYNVIKISREKKLELQKSGKTPEKWSLLKFPDPPKGRGDIPVWMSLGIFFVVSTIGIIIAVKLVPGFPFIFFLIFGLFYSPIISYINARMVGLIGQGVGVPYLNQIVIFASGYRGLDIQLVPGGLQIHQEGGSAQNFRINQLTGTRFTSILKANLVLMPILFIFGFIYWSVIWKLAPIPSSSYPYTQQMWRMSAMNTCLGYTMFLGAGVREGKDGFTKWENPPISECKDTTWYWRCKVYDGRCDSEWSNIAQFHVQEFKPEIAENKEDKTFLSKLTEPVKKQENAHPENHVPPPPEIMEQDDGKKYKKGEAIILKVKNSKDPDKDDQLTYIFEIDKTRTFDSPDRIITQPQSMFVKNFRPQYAVVGLIISLSVFIILNSGWLEK